MEHRLCDKVTVNAVYVDGNDGDEIDMYIAKVGYNDAGQKSYRLSKEPHKGGQESGVSSWGGFTEDDFIVTIKSKAEGDYIDIVDTENQEITASRVKKVDCITMDSYWTGTALSKSGIQY